MKGYSIIRREVPLRLQPQVCIATEVVQLEEVSDYEEYIHVAQREVPVLHYIVTLHPYSARMSPEYTHKRMGYYMEILILRVTL